MPTHPKYPARIDEDDKDYDSKCPFFEDPVLKKFAGIWADRVNVSEEELKERSVWHNNRLISLKESNIKFVKGKPICEIRTGIKGRGLLGRYGPNHAADPIVTKFNYAKLQFEFVSAERTDTIPPQWCIPGGMVDPGEAVSQTLKREFTEEVASTCDQNILDLVFKNGKILYSGPTCGDPRTTDSAWIETQVVHYHLSNHVANKIKLTPQPGENRAVKWISCSDPNLYGDHAKFVCMARNNARWGIVTSIFKNLIQCFVIGGLGYATIDLVRVIVK